MSSITFMIGNGFDLRMGMKTRFADMYEGYIAQESPSIAIERFKEMLRKDAPEYKTWGDFEMAMAEKAKEFEDEAAFIECLRDFKLYMAGHLQVEQKQFKNRMGVRRDTGKLCKNEARDSLQNFYMGLSPNVRNKFKAIGIDVYPEYKAISFNYTDIFDTLLFPGMKIVHIHGTLDAEVVLGADNLDQVKGLPYIATRRFMRAFIKPEFNNGYNSERVTEAEEIIKNSNIICIYGMSLGESDHSWVVRLKEWLLEDEDHHLVYFMYDETVYNRLLWDAIMDAEEDRIDSFLERFCDSEAEKERIYKQIHIPVGYDIFKVDEILKNEETLAGREIETERERIKFSEEEKARTFA